MSSRRSRFVLALLPALVTLLVVGLAFANAETGQRGYVVTGDTTFLKPADALESISHGTTLLSGRERGLS